ncbi:MAG: tyrosine-type recombinase/integrase, partial [Chloroflexota bacterium]|nr:tyrosine-type recombinase/integrase [Chloroflexota bacterium]
KIACPDRRALIELLMLTGMRGSEARYLAFNPISYDSSGAPLFSYEVTKTGVGLHTIPVPQQVVEIVDGQQQRVRERYGKDTTYLFPRTVVNPDGALPWSHQGIRRSLTQWLTAADVRDRNGQPVWVTAHQFRHTFGSRMVNQGIDVAVVQRILGHKTIAMTEHYARLNDQRLRQEFERFSASRVNIYGQLLPSLNSDAEWTKERLARALVTTQNGYCGRPLQLDCPHPNACLTCPDFLTDVSYVASHRRQLVETRRLISAAEVQRNTRMVEMNRQVVANLESIIASLEPFEAGPNGGDAA